VRDQLSGLPCQFKPFPPQQSLIIIRGIQTLIKQLFTIYQQLKRVLSVVVHGERHYFVRVKVSEGKETAGNPDLMPVNFCVLLLLDKKEINFCRDGFLAYGPISEGGIPTLSTSE